MRPGAHLRAENYDRAFDATEIFALLDDLVPRVVSTTADMYGVLLRSMSEALRDRDPDTLSADEAVLRAFGFFARVTADDHAEVRRILERAVERAPNHADCWAMLARMYTAEHMHDFNPRPDPLSRALDAARRAVAAAPSHQLTHYAQAEAHFFRREYGAFRNAAERAMALNAMDGDTLAYMGILIAYSGDWDHGCALAEQAMQLNPHHPGWFRFCLFINAYRKRDYRAAVDIALKMNMPSYFMTHAALAMAYGQLGERDAATRALRELLAQKPDFDAREAYGRWIDPGELIDHVLDGLRKAGLAVEPASASGSPAGQ